MVEINLPEPINDDMALVPMDNVISPQTVLKIHKRNK